MTTTIKSVGETLKNRWRRVAAALVIVGLAATGAIALFGRTSEAGEYTTAKAARRTVETTVSATGTLQAVTTVQVGSQASGTVAWLGADFNSQVKKGEVIARLDPATLQAQVANAQASLASAQAAVAASQSDVANQQANVKAADANVEANRVQAADAKALVARYQQISEVLAQRDIEAAKATAGTADAHVAQAQAQAAQARTAVTSSQAKVAQAQAQVSAARAELDQANANLAHTEIVSPIDGVVVSRAVDVGQTVAASLSAPVLFTIAADLTRMQVLASIDEADVGPVKSGQEARFTVDAFPDASFTGTVSQVRLNATAVQNVVTYTAVIDVANADGKLMPGMTANLTIPTASSEDALAVPNAALRFKPTLTADQLTDVRARRAASNKNAEAPAADAPKARPDQGGQTVWVLAANDKLERRNVTTGITDGRYTAITSGDLNEGDVVVTGQTSADDATAQKPATSAPFGQQQRGGPTGGGRPSGGGGSRGGR